MEKEFVKIANRVSVVSIVGNVGLSLFKLWAGIWAHSSAMVSDAVHSGADVLATFVVMIGIKCSLKTSDKEHPYGHERMECVSAIILAMVLFVTACGIGIDAVWKMFHSKSENLQIPGLLALIAAIVSIIVKEAMYWYTRYYAKKIESGALVADAWHHRSDALASMGTLVGIAGARMAIPVMDSVASLVIFGFIVKAAWDIFEDAMNKMVDHCCDADTERQIYDCVLKNEKVERIDLLKTRIFGNRIYVDVEIEVDGSYNLKEAHEVAEAVHKEIERNFTQVKHIMVHVNPFEEN